MTSVLDGLVLLSSMSQEDKDNLALFCQERHVEKGEVLFSEGDFGNAMYFLKKGKFNIFKNFSGNQVKIGNVVAEEVLGEMALFQDRNSRMATAIADEDSVLAVVLDFSIKELKNKHPEVIEKIKEIIEYRNAQNKEKRIV